MRYYRKPGEATLAWLVETLKKKPPHRVNGTAVFLTGHSDAAPSALLHNLKHNHMLHERNIVLTFKTADIPRVANSERINIQKLSDTFTAVVLASGSWSSRALSTSWCWAGGAV